MDRRSFLGAATVAGLVHAAPNPNPHQYHLRYAPRLDWLTDIKIEQRLQVFADWGFPAFEYNGLPRQRLARNREPPKEARRTRNGDGHLPRQFRRLEG